MSDDNDGGIVYFEGGPLDGKKYYVRDLLAHDAMTVPEIVHYDWTSERKVSEKTGAVAQVWRFRGDGLPARHTEEVAPMPERPAGAPKSRAEQEDEAAAAAAAATAVESEPAAEATDSSAITGADLGKRRSALRPRVSREKFAELTGTTPSWVYRAEKKTESMSKADIDKYLAKLEELEGGAGE